jgi:hypothetical protein
LQGLHPYTTIVGKPANYYLKWAQQEWTWLSGTGMENAQGLFNDGLNVNVR